MNATLRRLALILLLLPAGCIVPGAPDESDLNAVDDNAVVLVDRIKDKPTDLEAHADLLRLQIQRGDAEGARGTVEHAMFHNPGDFRAPLLAAQFYRWQLDLITAEKMLLKSRDLAPAAVEPRIALAALYSECALEEQELQQRRIVTELAEAAFRAEFELDYAYALSHAGRPAEAAQAARRVVDAAGAGKARARAWILLAQLALDAGEEAACLTTALEARKADIRERGPLRFLARLAGALQNPEPLLKSFDEALATQEDPEARFAALFGAWTACTKLAVAAGRDPDGQDAHAYWARLRDLDPGQVDALSRRYQVVSLLPTYTEETSAVKQMIEEQRVGLPAKVQSLDRLMLLWRAEDCLRLGAARPSIAALRALEKAEPALPGLRLMLATALFVARQDGPCRDLLASLLAEAKAEPDELMALQWQLDLRAGKAPELARALEARGEQTTQAALWTLAVARLHTYRRGEGKAGGGK